MAKSRVEGAGSGCCSTLLLRPHQQGDVGGELGCAVTMEWSFSSRAVVTQWPCDGHLLAMQWSRSGYAAVV